MKKIILIILLFVISISLFACSNEKELANPPTLKILYDNDSIDAEMGTYSWTTSNSDGTKTTIESDTDGPIELVKGKEPLKVSPESTIKLDFSHEPEGVRVYIWEDEDKQLEQVLTDMELIIPELDGLIIYEVVATWEQGIVHYAFSVDID